MSNPKDIPAFVRRLLASMTSWNASDVFLNVGRPPAARVHGSVVAVDLPKMSDEDIEGIAAEVLSEDALAKLRDRGDIDAGYALPDGRRFRFNFGRQAGGLGAVIRLRQMLALAPEPVGGDELPAGGLDLRFRRGVQLRLVNVGPRKEVEQTRLGFEANGRAGRKILDALKTGR